MRFTIADFLPTFLTLVYGIYYCGLFAYFLTLVYGIYYCGLFAYFLDPSIYEVTLYKIVTRGVISTKVESGLLARFARSSTTIIIFAPKLVFEMQGWAILVNHPKL